MRFTAWNHTVEPTDQSSAYVAMVRGRYTEASRLAGKYGAANARHTPDRLCTSGLATMIVRSSKAKQFHNTTRRMNAAAVTTSRYTRLVNTAHHISAPPPGP